MLQCSLAVSQRALKRQFFSFPLFVLEFYLGEKVIIFLAVSSRCLHQYCHLRFVYMYSDTDPESNNFY